MPDQDGDEFVVSDPELIARVRAGDREAFGELYRRHAGPATTLARQFSRSATESDDLVSESFARVLDNLLAGKGPDTAFRAYLFTTVRNTAYDRTRKDKRLQFTEDMSAHDVAVVGDDPVLANLESGMIAAAFAKLPERWQAVLWHTQVEGESPAEVGALLGMAPGAVSSLAFRAREGLREAYLQAHLAETAAERCRTTVERLGAWTRGGLSKREKAQVDAHLEECDRCRALAAELQEVNTGLRALLAPLILGGAAAGYVATLGPVTPLAAAGTLWPGIAGAGAHTAGATGATGTGAGAAGGTAAGGTAAGGTAAAAAGGGTAGAAAAGATAGAATATGAAAGAAAGGGTTAAAAAAGAASVGAAALATTGGAGTAAARPGAAGGSAAGGAAAGGSAAGGSAAGGSAAGGSSGAAAGGTGAAAGATAGAATGASGLVGVLSGVSIVGWVAVGAVAAAAIIVAAVIAVSRGSSSTSSADQAATLPSPPSVTTIASETEFTDDTLSSVTLGSSTSATTAAEATDTTATTDSSVVGTTTVTDTSATSTTNTTAPAPQVDIPILDTSPPQTVPPELGPAALAPTGLTISQPLVAGGTGAFSLTVTNTGQQDSAPDVPLDVTLPQGVSVQSVDVTPGASGLRRAAVGYLQARAPAQCLPAGAPTCSVPLGVVAPNAAFIVTITVDVDPAVQPDATSTATVSIFGVTISTRILPDQIQPGISTLTASPGGPFFAPSTNTLGITATRRNGVTKPGPLTFALTGDTSFGSTPADCFAVGAAPIQRITCTDIAQKIGGLTLEIGADQPAGPLPLTVTDAGSRIVALTDSTDKPLQVRSAPAALSLDIQGGAGLPAGGTGAMTVTATNGGGLPSAAAPIHYTFPTGVTVTGIDIDGVACATVAQDACTLPSVGPSTPRIVTFQLAALPEAITGDAVVTIDAAHDEGTLAVDTGIADLTASPAGPFLAPSTTAMDISVTPVTNVLDPGPITFTLTTGQVTFGGPPAGCTASATDPTHEITCTANPIADLTLEISREQKAGPLPLKVTDVGDRDITAVLRDSAGNELTVRDAPPKLTITAPRAEPFYTGGTGSASFTVNNGGGQRSPATPIDVTPPSGVEVTSVQSGGASCVSLPGSPCQLPPVDGGSSATVTVNLTALPSATGGQLTVTIGDATAPSTFLVVTSGVADVAVSPNSPYLAPSSTTLTLRAGYHRGVTDPGPLTLTLTGGVRFTAVPDACSRDALGGRVVPPTQQVRCDGATIDGLEMSIDKGQPGGPLPLVVTDAARNQVDAVRDGDGHTLEVVPASPAHLKLSPIDPLTFTAGTTGTITTTVTNDGGQQSDPAPITRSTTAGITVTAITVGGTDCALADCAVPPLDAGKYITVVFAVDVPPTAQDGEFDVSIGGESTTAPVKIESGVASLRASPGGPYLTGEAAVITVTATPAIGVGTLGPITLQPTDPGLRLGPAPAGCHPEGTGGLRCDGPVITDLTLDVSATAQPGPLPLRAIDAGGRRLDMTDVQGHELAIVQLGPALLDISGLTLSDPSYAGGSAVMTLQVANGGQQASSPLPIVVQGPHGVSVSTVAVGGADPCEPSQKSPCTLPVITAGHSVDVTLNLTLDPDAQNGSVQVTIGQAADSATLVVLPGISSLRGTPDDPLPIGTTTVLQVTAQPQEGVADPGPITFPLVSDGVSIVGYPTNCHPRTTDQGVDVIDCTGEVVAGSRVIAGLGVYVGPKVPPGSLPLVADLAGDRSMRITDSNGVPLRIGPPLPPDHLVLSAPQFTAEPTAGSTGTLTLTATNSGGQPSLPLPIAVTTPTGVTVSSIQVAGQPSCTPTAEHPCVLPPIEPTRSEAITVTLGVEPSAQQKGTLTVSVEDTRDGSVSTDLTIRAGVSLLAATPATALPAGATSTLRLDATLQPGVTDPGPITFPLQVDGVYVASPYPPGCHSTGAAIECSGPRIDGLVLFVSRNQPAGPLPLQARFAGGQTLAITDSAGHPVQVGAPVPPAGLALSGLQPGRPTIAGGTGTVTLTATNNGGEASQPAPITVTTPPGVAVARIDLAGIDPAGIDTAASSCTPSDRVPCQLPSIAAGRDVQLSIALTATPRAKDGPLTVSTGGATASLKTLVVHSGMTSIVSEPGGPFAQGSTTPLTLTAQTTVETPGAITLILGRGDVSFGQAPEGCTRGAGGDDHSGHDNENRTITCTGPVIAGLPLTVGAHQPAGLLPLTAVDAGGRDVPVTDRWGHRPVVGARAHARLEPAITQVSDPLIAGGSGSLTLTVHNAGGTASEPATLGATLPTGIDVVSYRVGGSTCTPAPLTTCAVPPVAAGSTKTVAVTLLVGAQAKGGEMTFTVDGQSVRTTVRVVGSVGADLPAAALGWQVTAVSAPLRAGGSASATVAITNTGGQPSQPRTVLVTPPAGMGISAITAGDGALCSAAGQTCTLPPIAPGATSTLTAAVTAAPEAHSGSLVLTSDDQRLEVPLTVDGGVQAVTATGQDTLVGGSTARLQVAVAGYPGVTDLGRYLLALRTDQAWFSGYPANCQVLADRTGNPSELTCTGATVDNLQLTLSGDQPAGSLALFAVDAGGRSLPVTDTNGAPLVVVEPSAATAQAPADGADVTPPSAIQPSVTQPSATPPAATASTHPGSPSVAPTSGDEPGAAPTSAAQPSTVPTSAAQPNAEPTPAAGTASSAGSAAPASAGTALSTASRAAR